MEEVKYIEKNYKLEGEQPRKIVGMNRPGLYQLFAKLGFKVGAEVGPERGFNALMMFENIPGLKMYGIDSYKLHPQASYLAVVEKRKWNQDYWNRVRDEAASRLKGKDYTLIQKYSEQAIVDIPDESLDFIYFDADHSYDFVMADIILWSRKIKIGGIISGHDYYHDENSSRRRAKVVQAVDDYTKVHGIKFFITSEDHEILQNDFYPSYFWVKEKDYNVIV